MSTVFVSISVAYYNNNYWDLCEITMRAISGHECPMRQRGVTAKQTKYVISDSFINLWMTA